MGLDNGISVKRTEQSNKIPELQVLTKSWDTELRYDFEVAYWRKCWGVRTDIMSLGIGYNQDRYIMNGEEVEKVIELLQTYNNETWEYDHSIWEWDEIEPHIKRYIENLKILRKLMDKYDLEVYFYDSY